MSDTPYGDNEIQTDPRDFDKASNSLLMQKNLTIDYDANNSSLPDISNLNASTSSLVIPPIKTSPGKLRYK